MWSYDHDCYFTYKVAQNLFLRSIFNFFKVKFDQVKQGKVEFEKLHNWVLDADGVRIVSKWG